MVNKNYSTCTIITIGDELLIGQTIDTNSAWIAKQLNPIGIRIHQRIAVGDVAEDILEAFATARKHSEILLITGGLGPTRDDITKNLLCNYFHTELVVHEPTLNQIKTYFEKRNRPMLQVNLDQALVPANCIPLFNAVGTAPGLLFEDGTTTLVAMPGVPFEMQYLVEEHVIPFLKQKYHTPNYVHRTLVTSGEGESFIANKLTDFEDALPPSIKLAYLPKLGVVKLRLTGLDIDESILDEHFEELKRRLKSITVTDTDQEIEVVIAQLLRTHQKQLALAESCTGGYIASLFTAISGASHFFKGSLVTYSNESKVNLLGIQSIVDMQATAVSEQIAKDMATAVRSKLHSDIGLGIVGYLEKNDHDNSVCIAVDTGDQCVSKVIRVPYDRQKNTVLATNTALNFLLQCIRTSVG
jgi:nicotinamide-nucleotide amidase